MAAVRAVIHRWEVVEGGLPRLSDREQFPVFYVVAVSFDVVASVRPFVCPLALFLLGYPGRSWTLLLSISAFNSPMP